MLFRHIRSIFTSAIKKKKKNLFIAFREEATRMCSKRHRANMQLSILLITIGMTVVVDGDAPKGLHFVGVGYNLLEGNPEGGDVTNGGVDPGLLFTRKIFKLTWNTNKKSMDNRFSVPDQVTFAPRSSCVTTNKKEVFSGSKSYQEKLNADVQVSGKRKKRVLRFQSKRSHADSPNQCLEISRLSHVKPFIVIVRQTLRLKFSRKYRFYNISCNYVLL